MSIHHIANGIRWTNNGLVYLELKDKQFELVVDYLNASTIDSLQEDTVRLEAFERVRATKNRQTVEDYILAELEGFNYWGNGYSAYIAGAHDKSASIRYNIQTDQLYLLHPNVPSIQKFPVVANELMELALEMIEIHRLNERLQLGGDRQGEC
ncbi:MAG: hypothetical protein ACFB10_14960 [Salibacteraceae bacterium]